MRRISKRREALNRQARPIRDRMIARAGCCMLCGASPRKPHKNLPAELSQLCVHEIANGPMRHKALDKGFATLVTCWHCNGNRLTDKKLWPEARQLAVLLQESPEDYDLEAYLKLTSPQAMQRITQEEVSQHWRQMYGAKFTPQGT